MEIIDLILVDMILIKDGKIHPNIFIPKYIILKNLSQLLFNKKTKLIFSVIYMDIQWKKMHFVMDFMIIKIQEKENNFHS